MISFATADAVEYFRTAISMLCDAGRFSNAAKLQKQIAEIYENQDNKEEALENYRQAADYFSGENQTSSANNMLLKVAQFSAQLERYDGFVIYWLCALYIISHSFYLHTRRYDAALEIYESIARASMESNLLKFNAKSHLLNAGICALATKDLVLVQMKLNEFQEIDYTFGDSREGRFLQAMVQSFENFSGDGFADAVYQFDTISKIEPWKISILLKVKESIMGEVDVAQDLT